MRARFPWRRRAAVPTRVYAIGDVHGEFDLFDAMIERIRLDVGDQDVRRTRIVVLGDFIDRGPQSAQLVRLFMQLRRETGLIVLKGNHEAIMVDALAGDYAALDLWLAHGGAATLHSFGVDPAMLEAEHGPALLRHIREAIGPEVPRWLAQLPSFVRIGGHYLVHAGIRPGVDLARQVDADRLWIGDDFLDSDADHGAVVVHGHTIYEEGVFLAPNRIGVDTGAYRTGRLSAVRLDEGTAVITVDRAALGGAREDQ